MLTARNVIASTIVVAVLSLVGATLSLLRTPDSGGMGSDSFGTRAHGYRAFFEILSELGIPVRRRLEPPTEQLGANGTLVFWAPRPKLVQLEPAYLKPIAGWIRAGGHVVVAPMPKDSEQETDRRKQRHVSEETDILKELGLAELTIEPIDQSSGDSGTSPTESPDGELRNVRIGSSGHRRSQPSFRDNLWQAWSAKPIPIRSFAVKTTGTLADLHESVRTVTLPRVGLEVLKLADSEPIGTVTLEDDEGTEHILVAAFRLGEGEVVVVSDPALAANRSIAKNDNSVLAAYLVASEHRNVIFDEFYHGLTVRGNPLWLFTHRTYSVVTLCLLMLVGVWVWRQSTFLGPPQETAPAARRSIGEYVEAMARFLHRGRSSHGFVLQEVRDGVLRTIRSELRLPPGRDCVEELSVLLARRDPERAERLLDAVGSVDMLLSRREQCTEKETVNALRRICTCLSNPIIEPSDRKSQR